MQLAIDMAITLQAYSPCMVNNFKAIGSSIYKNKPRKGQHEWTIFSV
jgi:hypothetical protein